MDFKSRFNNRRHCDVKVVVDGSTFYLHRFPLEAASTFFDERFGSDSDSDDGDQPARPARPTVELQEFPGGAPSFESVARYCYGFDLELDLENIAPMFAAARYLGMATLQDKSEKFFVDTVLQSPRAAATVLKVATSLQFPSEDVMVDVVGRCINVVARKFEVMPECSVLPPDCFSCIIRTARDMGVPKDILEAGVQRFCTDRLPSSRSEESNADVTTLTPAEFEEVVSAPGKTHSSEHAAVLFQLLDRVLSSNELDHKRIERLCLALHALGLWTQLPHKQIQEAYMDKRLPDRFCTLALMAENRRLIKRTAELEALLGPHAPPTEEQKQAAARRAVIAERQAKAVAAATGAQRDAPPAAVASQAMSPHYGSVVAGVGNGGGSADPRGYASSPATSPYGAAATYGAGVSYQYGSAPSSPAQPQPQHQPQPQYHSQATPDPSAYGYPTGVASPAGAGSGDRAARYGAAGYGAGVAPVSYGAPPVSSAAPVPYDSGSVGGGGGAYRANGVPSQASSRGPAAPSYAMPSVTSYSYAPPSYS